VAAEVWIPDRHIAAELRQWFTAHGATCEKSEALAVLNEKGLRAALSFSRHLRRRNIDLVNIHSPGYHMPLAELVAARLAGLPAVVSIHGLDATHVNSRTQYVRNRTIASPLSGAIIVPTEIVRQQQARFGISDDKLEFIRNSVPAQPNALSREEARDRLGLSHDEFIVLCFGRLVPDKGIDTLLRAVELLPPELLVRLQVLIGGIGDLESLQELVGERSRQTIRFLGHVTDTSPFYSASDVFVLPSRHEPFGLVFVEAGRHGVPSIGTNVGGIPEAVADGKTGLLIEPDDPDVLAQTILRLSENQGLRDELGEAARARADELFSEETMLTAYAKVFSRLVATRRGRPRRRDPSITPKSPN
jgi:glycosyltransferase involved in cell wall biosynthesis